MENPVTPSSTYPIPYSNVRHTQSDPPDPFRPVGCGEEGMTIETDIRSLFDEAQSMDTKFEDDMRKRKSK